MLTMTAPECMALWMAGVAAALLAGALAAQPVYRIVGADGRVTYADTPPAVAGQNKVNEAGRAPEADLAVPLPFSLRAVASQYPVTLYTTANCAPCATGRTLLVQRGIPFAEKTITSPEDADALQSLSGETALPLLTIGAQQIKGVLLGILVFGQCAFELGAEQVGQCADAGIEDDVAHLAHRLLLVF